MAEKLSKIARKILSLRRRVREGLIDPLGLRLKPLIDRIIVGTRGASLEDLRNIGLAVDGISEILLEKVKTGVRRARVAPYSDPVGLIERVSLKDLVESLKSCWRPILSVSGIVSADTLYSMALVFMGKPDRHLETSRTVFPEIYRGYELHESFVEEMERFKENVSEIISKEGKIELEKIVLTDKWEDTLKRATFINFLLDNGYLNLVKVGGRPVLVFGTGKGDSWARVWIVRRKGGKVEVIA